MFPLSKSLIKKRNTNVVPRLLYKLMKLHQILKMSTVGLYHLEYNTHKLPLNTKKYMLILILQCFSTFNFTVPFLSYLSVVLLVAVTVVLYWVPVRYLIMAWGVNKFARKLIRPHTIPNNEVLDLLSRVPTNEDLVSDAKLSADCVFF